ncbi:1-acyl-sn-glycerol-3-phosphate acyltransferase [Leptolyngbya sp. AN02str]|uniref:1-acyl-sn-glycerol-3-phosphate acyltransferase n=1 Tax=Leptolyngbya sp. AN02str TaxID=3423363 RepID=UPI003D32457D
MTRLRHLPILTRVKLRFTRDRTHPNRMANFYPPLLNPWLVKSLQAIAPPVAQWRYQMRLNLEPQSVERIRALATQRLLLLPNHPTHFDWLAVFLLSGRVGHAFNILAAQEQFKGATGWLMQRVGVYSVRRGMGDRPSIAKTLEILTQPSCRLIIFPEGGYSFQNDTVMPFRSGAVQIALQAMSKVAKQDEQADLYVLPVSLKYRYLNDMAPIIDDTLTRLERSLQIPTTTTDFYDRLLAVADRAMLQFEHEYALTLEQTSALDRNQRIQAIRQQVLAFCEASLGLDPKPNDPLRERVYRVQRSLDSTAEAAASISTDLSAKIRIATNRLLNFDALYYGYVADQPTPERFLDTLIRLERAIFNIDQPAPKGDCEVIVHVGEAVNLADYLEAYQRDRTSTTEQLTDRFRQAVQAGLDHINSQINS